MIFGDLNDLIPLQNWVVYRTNCLHDDGVTEFVKLTLVAADTDYDYEFAIPLEYALQLGWQLVGEGARLT